MELAARRRSLAPSVRPQERYFMEEVFSVIGKVLAVGGGAAGVAYLHFKVFAVKWIETKFFLNN